MFAGLYTSLYIAFDDVLPEEFMILPVQDCPFSDGVFNYDEFFKNEAIVLSFLGFDRVTSVLP